MHAYMQPQTARDLLALSRARTRMMRARRAAFAWSAVNVPTAQAVASICWKEFHAARHDQVMLEIKLGVFQ